MTPNTIRVDAIAASKTNPRKHFDKAALQELAESIAKHGVLQPILVRPNGSDGTYELVAGERRWRAAKIAQLERIPATVRELTDAEVLEIQVVENLQRADLHPLEEAEGYEALMKCQHADGRAYTADEIAAKVGKSKSYVYQRLKLTALTEKSRETFYAGRLDASRALLIARIPADLQAKAIAEILGDPKNEWSRDLSFREARDRLHREFMLDLGKPPFDVKAIYFAGKTSAQPIGTPCGECPKRTGNQPELFEDVKSGDVCTDPACFAAKTAAHIEKVAEEKRAKGQTVLTGNDAKAVLPNGYGPAKGGYTRLDRPLTDDPKYEPLAKRLGKKLPPVTLVEDLRSPGQFIKVVEETAARELLVAAGQKWADKDAQKVKRASSRTENARANENAKLTREVNLAIHKALRDAVRRDGLSEADLRAIVGSLRDTADMDEAVWDLVESKNGRQISIDKVPASELQPLLIDCAMGYLDDDDVRRDLAKLHGIDVKAIEARVKAELKTKAEAEKETKPAKTRGKAKKATQAEEVSA